MLRGSVSSGATAPLGRHLVDQCDGRPVVRQVERIVALLIARGDRERDEHRRLAERGQFADRPGTAA
ncbi:hypothetical protein [Streptomyces sp. G44]|uniref:hypothetical protein n=1 Tax=Streptomyces sp. G44 TaxID=2807632 RepID=UPI0027DB6C05|nr:hypothetical protein [Streptomyces sp. G44]